jgi:putative AlgH/UPF0301 family transcriptional regulator
MVEVVRMDRKDFATLLLGAAARWLSPAAPAEHGGRVTLLVANPACNDAAYAHTVVVLQPGESEEVGVMLNRPGEPELVLWRPGELAEELKRGLWLKLEVPPETVLR